MAKRTLATIVSMATILLAPAALAEGVLDGTTNAYHVDGESLDSGLGALSASYQAAEYQVMFSEPAGLYHVAGESLDSGLGALDASYAAAEYQIAFPDASRYHVAGEKLDSGLGELTQEDISRVIAAASRISTAAR